MLGRTIQNYRVEELLGEGGMGTVYKASDVTLRRHVAVKMLHNHLVRDTSFMERFRNEAILSAQLNHPNVTTLFNFLQDHNDTMIIMELVNGVTVERFLKQSGKLSVETAFKIAMQTLDGLQHAHSRGILHRDIKAANLMLTPEGTIKLMDFGIARLEGSTRMTRADRVVGTLEYMAPELLNGAEPSVQSDLYAVGVLLYELLSGKMPFESSTDITLISQILTKKPISIRSRIPELPKPVEEILDKLLNKNPEKRYRKATELRSALAALVMPGTIPTEPAINLSKQRVPATVANGTPVKPETRPSRMATSAGGFDYQGSTQSFWKSVRTNVMSLEGAILIGSLILASGIISVWSFSGTGGPTESNLDTLKTRTTVRAIRIAKKDTVLGKHEYDAPQTAFVSEVAATPIREIEDSPVPPVQRKRRVDAKPVAARKAEIPAPVTVENEAPAPAPKKKTSVELKGAVISVEMSQTVSTEQSTAGETFWMHTTAPVQLNGVTIIPTGARVRGQVDKVLSKADHKRSGLWVHLEVVETVDGQWIPVDFKWDDTAFHALELRRGLKFKKVRVERVTLSMAI